MKKVFCALGAAVGVLSIIMAIITFSLTSHMWPEKPNRNNYSSESRYQSAMADYKEDVNSRKPSFATPFALGSILLVGGLTIDVLSAYKLVEEMKKDSKGMRKFFAARYDAVAPVSDGSPENNPAYSYNSNYRAAKDWYCSQCGLKNISSQKVCFHCGKPRQ